jgi:hypothetical protein
MTNGGTANLRNVNLQNGNPYVENIYEFNDSESLSVNRVQIASLNHDGSITTLSMGVSAYDSNVASRFNILGGSISTVHVTNNAVPIYRPNMEESINNLISFKTSANDILVPVNNLLNSNTKSEKMFMSLVSARMWIIINSLARLADKYGLYNEDTLPGYEGETWEEYAVPVRSEVEVLTNLETFFDEKDGNGHNWWATFIDTQNVTVGGNPISATFSKTIIRILEYIGEQLENGSEVIETMHDDAMVARDRSNMENIQSMMNTLKGTNNVINNGLNLLLALETAAASTSDFNLDNCRHGLGALAENWPFLDSLTNPNGTVTSKVKTDTLLLMMADITKKTTDLLMEINLWQMLRPTSDADHKHNLIGNEANGRYINCPTPSS